MINWSVNGMILFLKCAMATQSLCIWIQPMKFVLNVRNVQEICTVKTLELSIFFSLSLFLKGKFYFKEHVKPRTWTFLQHTCSIPKPTQVHVVDAQGMLSKK